MKTYEVIKSNVARFKNKPFSIEITNTYKFFGWTLENIKPYKVGISIEPPRKSIRRFATEADAQEYIDKWLDNRKGWCRGS